jgi:hypothetical protein
MYSSKKAGRNIVTSDAGQLARVGETPIVGIGRLGETCGHEGVGTR